MNELKLEKCPFCGEVPIVWVQDGLTAIKCNNTECWICPQTSFYTSADTAVIAWNERSPRRTAEYACGKCIVTSGAHESSGQHIRDLLAAEEEGRLDILPPSAKEGDPKPDCFYNDCSRLWCLGQTVAGDDEPTEQCKRCWYCESGDYSDDRPVVVLGGGEGD